MATLKNYAAVQAALNNFVQQAGVTPGQAPHGAFWNSMTYTQFTTGNVPGVPLGPWKILIVGDSKNSNIIQILSGVGSAAADFGQMPQPNPPYNPEQMALITQLADWIDAGCPNTFSETREEQKLTAATVTFQQTIKPYFTTCYRQHMMFFCDLWQAGDCQTHWQEIHDAVADGSMPKPGCPEGVWNSQKRQQFLSDFQSWKDGGFQ